MSFASRGHHSICFTPLLGILDWRLKNILIVGIDTNEEAISLQPAWSGNTFSPFANSWILMSCAEKHSHAPRSCFLSAIPMQMQADLMKGEIEPNWHSWWSIQHPDVIMTALMLE